jgi:tetratricopeptide repeat protein 21B
MIDIYLNPQQELFYTCEGNRVYPVVQDNMESIEVLLDELDYKHFYAEKAVYNTYCNVIIRNEFDDSINFLETFLEENSNFTPALLCLCVTRMYESKTVDKQSLKEMTKLRMNPRWGDDSERAWLHVADFLVHAKMHERAENLLKKCLKVNKSSMKALEMLGQLYEKQENFVNAAQFYNMAWDISEKRDCQIGYRIASLQFKAQNWIKSISIAKQVSYS